MPGIGKLVKEWVHLEVFFILFVIQWYRHILLQQTLIYLICGKPTITRARPPKFLAWTAAPCARKWKNTACCRRLAGGCRAANDAPCAASCPFQADRPCPQGKVARSEQTRAEVRSIVRRARNDQATNLLSFSCSALPNRSLTPVNSLFDALIRKMMAALSAQKLHARRTSFSHLIIVCYSLLSSGSKLILPNYYEQASLSTQPGNCPFCPR